MSDKQLIIKTNWRYYRKLLLLGAILLPFFIGLFILGYVFFRLSNGTYLITDSTIIDTNLKVSIELNDVVDVRIINKYSTKRTTIYDLILEGSSSALTLRGIENARSIKESIVQLIAFKNELKESEIKRNAVQVKQDPGSLERLNDLTGLLQEGLISYDDYLQERKNFEDK